MPGARVETMLAEVGLRERAGSRVKSYSNGMKQRLLVARALLHQPRPGLDAHVAREIRSLVKELAEEGITIFLTTHHIEEADQLCDRVAFIDRGRIVALDTPTNLKAEHGQGERTTLEDVFVERTGKHLYGEELLA